MAYEDVVRAAEAAARYRGETIQIKMIEKPIVESPSIFDSFIARSEKEGEHYRAMMIKEYKASLEEGYQLWRQIVEAEEAEKVNRRHDRRDKLNEGLSERASLIIAVAVIALLNIGLIIFCIHIGDNHWKPNALITILCFFGIMLAPFIDIGLLYALGVEIGQTM
ncbi:MAG: hypothetical protein LBN99_06675 [Oscillospiraceae bacterium]|nr:hypothetical protein [Oscillospiraceae bacterium]